MRKALLSYSSYLANLPQAELGMSIFVSESCTNTHITKKTSRILQAAI
jgi:hypothetical protein